MDALDLLRAAFRRWYIIVSIVLLAVIAALTLVPEPDSTYSVEGSFTLTVVPQELGSTPALLAQLAQDRSIREQALAGIDGDANYTVGAGDDGFLTVRATAAVPETAIALVDRVLEILAGLVADDSLVPDDEYELFFRTISQPGRASLVPTETVLPVYEAEGSGVVGIVTDPATLDDIDTLLQIGDELTEDAVLDAIAAETDAEIRLNVSDRRAVATITSVSRSPEGAVAGFDAAIERAQDSLAVLVTRSAVADRAGLEVLRGPDDIFVEEGSAGTVLLGLVALSGVFAILIAVFVDALLMRQSRRTDGSDLAAGELPASFAQRVSTWRSSRRSDSDVPAAADSSASADDAVVARDHTPAADTGHVVTIAAAGANRRAVASHDEPVDGDVSSAVGDHLDGESVADHPEDEPVASASDDDEALDEADIAAADAESAAADADEHEPAADEDGAVTGDDQQPHDEESGSSRSGSTRATSSARR